MLQVEGRNLVYELLLNSNAIRVLVAKESKDDPRIQEIIRLASRRKTPVEMTERSGLDKASETGRHQGVIALVEAQRYVPMRKILEVDEACVVLLDRVQDPMNLGSILRTAEAAEVSGVVIPKRGGVGLTPTVLRASMGGGLKVPVVRGSLFQAVKLLKGAGAKVVGVDPSGTAEYFDERLTGGLALVLGGEDRGISPTLLSKCDSVVRIPMKGQIMSLNVGVAAAVVLYERMRQQKSVG
jgi:23S rRNA (guanosine2251-2'-O)-methyltransferase